MGGKGSGVGEKLAGIRTRASIVEFVGEFTQKHGYSPSNREIGDGVGVAQSQVSRHLAKLNADGRITYLKYVPRSVRVVTGDA